MLQLRWETFLGPFFSFPLLSSPLKWMVREVGMSGRQIETGNISSILAFTRSRRHAYYNEYARLAAYLFRQGTCL